MPLRKIDPRYLPEGMVVRTDTRGAGSYSVACRCYSCEAVTTLRVEGGVELPAAGALEALKTAGWTKSGNLLLCKRCSGRIQVPDIEGVTLGDASWQIECQRCRRVRGVGVSTEGWRDGSLRWLLPHPWYITAGKPRRILCHKCHALPEPPERSENARFRVPG